MPPTVRRQSGADGRVMVSDQGTARTARVQGEDHTEVVDSHEDGRDQARNFGTHRGCATSALSRRASSTSARTSTGSVDRSTALTVIGRALNFSVASITTD